MVIGTRKWWLKGDWQVGENECGCMDFAKMAMLISSPPMWPPHRGMLKWYLHFLLNPEGLGPQQKTQSWTPNLNDKGPHSFYLGFLRCSLLGLSHCWEEGGQLHGQATLPPQYLGRSSQQPASATSQKNQWESLQMIQWLTLEWTPSEAKKTWHHQALLKYSFVIKTNHHVWGSFITRW